MVENYKLWTIVEDDKEPNSSKEMIHSPLSHLKKNYENIKSPIFLNGVSKLYQFYNGRLSYKQIKDFLKTVDSYTLHKSSRTLKYNPSYSRYKRHQFQLDLVDIQNLSKNNDNYRFLLSCIDTFTRYGFCIPLKNKTSDEVLMGFKLILTSAGKYPDTIVTDGGSEFLNNRFQQFCKDNSIKFYRSYTSTHASFVERFNRTIKNKIYAYMDSKRTQRFIDVLPNIVDNYNNSVHRMINLTPSNAEKKRNHVKVRIKMEKYYSTIKKRKPKYKIGSTVRIKTLGRKFHRGFEVQNNEEIFVISSVKKSLPIPLYTLHTYGDPNEIIQGSFYENEITPTDLESFFIEKILRRTKNKVLVKWQGHEQPSWEPRAYIESVLKRDNTASD